MLSYLQSLITQYSNQEEINWDSVKSIENKNVKKYNKLKNISISMI